jgi:hypothetical protein
LTRADDTTDATAEYVGMFGGRGEGGGHDHRGRRAVPTTPSIPTVIATPCRDPTPSISAVVVATRVKSIDIRIGDEDDDDGVDVDVELLDVDRDDDRWTSNVAISCISSLVGLHLGLYMGCILGDDDGSFSFVEFSRGFLQGFFGVFVFGSYVANSLYAILSSRDVRTSIVAILRLGSIGGLVVGLVGGFDGGFVGFMGGLDGAPLDIFEIVNGFLGGFLYGFLFGSLFGSLFGVVVAVLTSIVGPCFTLDPRIVP